MSAHPSVIIDWFMGGATVARVLASAVTPPDGRMRYVPVYGCAFCGVDHSTTEAADDCCRCQHCEQRAHLEEHELLGGAFTHVRNLCAACAHALSKPASPWRRPCDGHKTYVRYVRDASGRVTHTICAFCGQP